MLLIEWLVFRLLCLAWICSCLGLGMSWVLFVLLDCLVWFVDLGLLCACRFWALFCCLLLMFAFIGMAIGFRLRLVVGLYVRFGCLCFRVLCCFITCFALIDWFVLWFWLRCFFLFCGRLVIVLLVAFGGDLLVRLLLFGWFPVWLVLNCFGGFWIALILFYVGCCLLVLWFFIVWFSVLVCLLFVVCFNLVVSLLCVLCLISLSSCVVYLVVYVGCHVSVYFILEMFYCWLYLGGLYFTVLVFWFLIDILCWLRIFCVAVTMFVCCFCCFNLV